MQNPELRNAKLSPDQIDMLARAALAAVQKVMNDEGYLRKLNAWCVDTYGLPYDEARKLSYEERTALRARISDARAAQTGHAPV